VDWSRLTTDWKTDRIEKAVILKPFVSPHERGVVLVSFDYQWPRLLGVPKLQEFTERYQLITAPTWCPPYAVENTLFPAQYPDKRIVTLISNVRDEAYFPRLSPKYHVVPLYASNWVNPDLYPQVPPEEKNIDIVMVAGFGAYKRHFALFRALRELPPGTRVVLVGQPNAGRDREALLREAGYYGVRDRIELRESVPDAVVVDTLAHAKIGLILSRREGSCVAVVESMIANTPIGVLEDATVGSKVFVNEHTGMLLRSENLGAQLKQFLERFQSYSPRQYALEQGWCCFGSTKKLNQALRQLAVDAGEEWTEDIAVHHWRPDPQLLHASDRERLESEYQDVQQRFGLQLGVKSKV
jgi:glycosyltransferase involved in cell wall biosynthesis